MEKLTDTYLISKVRSGSVSHFGTIIARYEGKLYPMILKIVQNKEDAREVMQDVFMSVFKSVDKFSGASSFSTYIYRIAYNTAISFIRKNQPLFVSLDDSYNDYEKQEHDFDEIRPLEKEKRLVALEESIKKLNPEERALVSLYYMEEKSIEECSVITGITKSNVKIRLFRIRKRLLELISDEIKKGERIYD